MVVEDIETIYLAEKPSLHPITTAAKYCITTSLFTLQQQQQPQQKQPQQQQSRPIQQYSITATTTAQQIQKNTTFD